MSQQAKLNLLQELDEKINIDIDSLDTDFLRGLSITPNDQTCNPRWLALQLEDPSSANLLQTTALELQNEGYLAVCTRLAVSFCRRNIDLIKGRVFVQTSPSAAYDTKQIIDHARLYASEFNRAGIPKTRYCVKIMATGPGLNAAKILQKEGISTLGTGVFSVPQAVACSQAGCLFISPYYNEIRTYIDTSLWPDVADPALEHPFSNRIAQMVQAYRDLFKKTGNPQPLIKNAGFRSYREVVATAELGCHSATLSKDTLQELEGIEAGKISIPVATKLAIRDSPYSDDVGELPPRLRSLLDSDPLAHGKKWVPADLNIDYLADNGKALDEIVESDEAAKRMVHDALQLFQYCEGEMKKAVEYVWSIAST